MKIVRILSPKIILVKIKIIIIKKIHLRIIILQQNKNKLVRRNKNKEKAILVVQIKNFKYCILYYKTKNNFKIIICTQNQILVRRAAQIILKIYTINLNLMKYARLNILH